MEKLVLSIVGIHLWLGLGDQSVEVDKAALSEEYRSYLDQVNEPVTLKQ